MFANITPERFREILSLAVSGLPNSFTEDFKAQVRTMDEWELDALHNALQCAKDTISYESHINSNPKTYNVARYSPANVIASHAHEVNRGAF